MTKKQVFILIGFIIILVSIPATLYLVRQTQIFQPKAAFIPKVEFVDATGSVITETQSPNVKLKITKETTPSPSPAVSPSPSPSVTTNSGITTEISCEGANLKAYIHGDITLPPSISLDSNFALWSTLVDGVTNQQMVYELTGGLTRTFSIAANIPPAGGIRGSPTIPLIGDGRTYFVRLYYADANIAGIPSFTGTPVAETSFNKICSATLIQLPALDSGS